MMTGCRAALLILGLVLLAPLSAQEPLAEQADIRLVVDISGSMKRTDPDNLRRPALSLLVRLLPPGSQAGVWTFGQQVNALVPHREVDDTWKSRALERVGEINSVALYTHIGAALEGAAYDRSERSKGTALRTDIILLTDGVVDVSPDPQISAREQQRVVRELVPELHSLGYRIHTIGLSDETDEALLRDMARGSDGLFSKARNAEQLMDSLLQIFQQTVPAERLPITGGLFLIDDSIEEFTALVRKEPDQDATELIAPDGQRYHADVERPELHWHSTPDYDLITVTDPPPGRWEINAQLQPHSRLTIISNLQLVVEPLVNNINVGEPIPVNFYLQDQRGVVSNPALLELLTLTLELSGTVESEQALKTWQGPPPDDGRYELVLPAPRRPGDYELRLTLDGKSFERLFTHRMTVASQFEVSLAKRIENEQVHWDLVVDGKETINPGQTDVVAHIRHSAGHSEVISLEADSPGIWRHTLTPEERANYRVSLQASGQTADGRPFEEHLPTQYFSYPEEGDPKPDPLGEAISALREDLEDNEAAAERARQGRDSEPPPSTLTLGEPQVDVEPSPPDVATREARKPAHPALLAGSLILANGLLLVLAYFGYRAIMGGRKPQPLDDTDDEPLPPEAGAPPPMQQIESELDSPGDSPDKPAPTQPTPKPESADDEESLFPLGDDQLFDDSSDDPNGR
ncbi:VWA domain-containing protein [Marinimicrobium sp. C6131]|uniref:VWA domain-containing protein n=1 Tax=Marinimicrobium sp. C6131 TaxID=3022676 RepID=UPI00223CF9DD|nr:VWA domain-containing protein [Marinimicrobium sp. C6131]UZJ44899.1 VWA domain-containing protein [Marinimicrobium sp. C6131]